MISKAFQGMVLTLFSLADYVLLQFSGAFFFPAAHKDKLMPGLFLPYCKNRAAAGSARGAGMGWIKAAGVGTRELHTREGPWPWPEGGVVHTHQQRGEHQQRKEHGCPMLPEVTEVNQCP